MKKVCLLFLFVSLLSGCAGVSVPPHSADTAILVIPKSHKNSSTEGWVRSYYLSLRPVSDSSSETGYKVWLRNDGTPYAVVGDIPEGRYSIDSLKWRLASRWRASHAMDDGWPVGYFVDLEKGKATVLPYSFNFEQYSKGASVYSGYRLEGADKEAYDSIKEQFAEEENGGLWPVVSFSYGDLSYWTKKLKDAK